MTRSMTLAASMLSVCVLAGCAQEPAMPPDTTAEDTAAITALRSGWAEAFEAGDAARLAGMYTTDATAMLPGIPTLSGRAAIEAHYAAQFAMASGTVDIQPNPTVVHGDVAYETGRFSGTMTPAAGGDPMPTEGRYIVVIRRDTDGVWRLSINMSNSASAETMKMMAEQLMMQQAGGGS